MEEDDEFLHKKAVPEEKPPLPKKGPVRIFIPAMRDLQDPEAPHSSDKPKRHTAPRGGPIKSLLGSLPKPKSEQLFQTAATPSGVVPKPTFKSLVPDSVTLKRKKPATVETATRPRLNNKAAPAAVSGPADSSGDEEDAAFDFFSLTSGPDDSLPKVSKNEIQLMVANRAAKMASTTAKFDQLLTKEEPVASDQTAAGSYEQHQSVEQRQAIDREALEFLVGGSSRAKRARMENVDVVELSYEQVMPSRDEWLRTSVAGATTAPVRGELKDGPKGVARKKHQITYLAHQAKSNEAELQAIWAANRQTQRQSQSKYGW